MKKLFVFSIIFLSLVGTNCNAKTTHIITDSEPFVGSLIISTICIEVFKSTEYSIITYTKDSNGNYQINLAVDEPHFTKSDFKNVKRIFCEER